jgi:hypothetical protein
MIMSLGEGEVYIVNDTADREAFELSDQDPPTEHSWTKHHLAASSSDTWHAKFARIFTNMTPFTTRLDADSQRYRIIWNGDSSRYEIAPMEN